MQADLPHTLYKERKNSTGKGASVTAPVRASDPAFELQKKVYERAMERKKHQAGVSQPVELDELFSKK